MSDCPCDKSEHPQRGDYAAGLTHIPRQWAGFPDFRAAMLEELRLYPALTAWRARGKDDVGVMLIEMFAYVLDVVGFYDAYIANRSYLRTATLPRSVNGLVQLIGYRPQPAVAAEAILAVTVEPGTEVVLPAGTAFRSSGEGGVAPQVFIATQDTKLHASKNEWTIAEQKLPHSKELLLDTASISLAADELVVFEVDSLLSVHEAPLNVFDGDISVPEPDLLEEIPVKLPVMGTSRVTALTPVMGPDGALYTRLGVPALGRHSWHVFPDGRVKKPSQSAAISFYRNVNVRGTAQASYDMDALYTNIHKTDRVVLENPDRDLGVAVVEKVERTTRSMGGLSVPITRVRLRATRGASLPAHVSTLHFGLVDCARLARPTKTELDAGDLTGDVALEPRVAPIVGAQPDEIALAGSDGTGALVTASILRHASGGSLRVFEAPEIPRPLATPIHAFGNLVRVVRGEPVTDEVLGSGDASVGFQSFSLENPQLTYVHDPGSKTMRRSTLQVWVDGVRWREVSSFFAAGPGQDVYIVRHDDKENTTVTFGDGLHGARLPTGGDNVVASYRFGAGAQKPATGTLTQPVDPPPQLRSVLNPTGAFGGADADRPKDVRLNAARSALTLGRAVSIYDVEALARDFGVRNAVARPHWDEATQGAVIQVWIVSDGSSVKGALSDSLSAQTGPEMTIQVDEATPVDANIALEIVTDPRRVRQLIVDAARAALLDPARGLLDPGNVVIGAGLFRSALIEAVQTVPGVVAVRSLSFNGHAMHSREPLEPGQYFAVTLDLTAEEGA